MLTTLEDRLPVSLGICPIVDAVVEIRFNANVPPQAVFGIVYERLRIKYSKLETLPILQLPPSLIDSDPNLQNKPQYRLVGNGYNISIGPNVVSVAPLMPYSGWAGFFPTVKDVFETFIALGVIKDIVRLGIRYSNFFEKTDIFQKVNLEIQFSGEAIPYRKTVVRTDLPLDGFSNTLQISNDASKMNPDGTIQLGSMIDIDTYKEYVPSNDKIQDVLRDVNSGHNVEKKIFWNLLNDALKSELKPTFS